VGLDDDARAWLAVSMTGAPSAASAALPAEHSA
jgi:hypothetical protein